jgi:hypothetical protein
MIGLCTPGRPRSIAAPFVFALMTGAAGALTAQAVNVQPAAAGCIRAGGSVENSTQRRDGRDARWRVHWSGDDCTIDLRALGDVGFNSDFTDVASIGAGGSFQFTATQGGNIRQMTVRSDGGRLVRSWTINGRDEAWGSDGQRWLAAMLVELDRVTAAGVDYRFPVLLAGGAGAVIDEAQLMAGDYPRGIYLRRLVDSVKLSDADYQRVVAIAAHDMHSDYEISRLLRAVADRTTLESAAVRQSYFDAVSRMSSDYERSRVLRVVLSKTPYYPEAGQRAITSAASFSSDYERSRVLLAAIDNKSVELDNVIPILETVTKSQSDYEKSRVMIAVATRWSLNGDTRKAYLRAANTIRSDYENRRVLSALVTQETRR